MGRPSARSEQANPDLLPLAAEKYTNVEILPSTIVALAGGSMTIALAYLVRGITPHLYALLMERGPVQYLTLYAFWFTLGMLFFKFRRLQQERAAFDLPFLQSFTAGRQVVGKTTILAHHEALEENLDPEQQKLLLVNRINKGIKQLKVSDSPAEAAKVLSTVAETDSAIIDSSYILIKYMIWAIPVLGFIGTVMGMTQAIGSFDVVLKGIKEVGFSGVQQSLGLVTSGLAVAFDTTFLALVLSALLNLFSNALQKREEDLLSDVEDFTTENIVNKLSVIKQKMGLSPSSGTVPMPGLEIKEAMDAQVRELKNMNKQNQINADELLAQIGRLAEALDQERGPGPIGIPGSGPQAGGISTGDFNPKDLQQLCEVLRAHAESLNRVGEISTLLQKNMEVMGKLPGAIDEMTAINRKLGELYSKIYKESFL